MLNKMLVLAASVAVLLAGPVFAHAKLKGSVPASSAQLTSKGSFSFTIVSAAPAAH